MEKQHNMTLAEVAGVAVNDFHDAAGELMSTAVQFTLMPEEQYQVTLLTPIIQNLISRILDRVMGENNGN